jgi:two-component system nitrate/nitrite response regulator NarL
MSSSRKFDPLAARLVMVASRSPLVRERWRQGLQGSFPVHEVVRRADLEQAMAGLTPDILLLDLTLTKAGGVTNLPAVQRWSPRTKIVLFTKTPDETEAIIALQAGAKGYCDQDMTASLLKRAVDRVQSGEIWVGRTLVPRLLEELTSLTELQQRDSSGKPKSRLERLSQRELEVAHLIGGGANNKEIATRLNISSRTVKAHVTTIFRKLGFSDRLRLALFVVNESLKQVKA